MRNPDIAIGLESLRGFNKLHKREPTYSAQFVIVQQMLKTSLSYGVKHISLT